VTAVATDVWHATMVLNGPQLQLYAAGRTLAVRWCPYFATALFAMTPVSVTATEIASVDRHWRVYIDFDAMELLGAEGFAAVLLHEVQHLIRDHHRRAEAAGAVGRRGSLAWNLAADASINDDLWASSIPVPDPVLPAHLGCPNGWTEEAYFETLWRQHGAMPGHRGCGSGSGGRPLPFELGEDDCGGAGAPTLRTAAAVEAIRSSTAAAVLEQVGAAAGRGEGELRRWARTTLQGTVRWQSLLGRELCGARRSAVGRTTPTYSVADRRGDATDVVLRPGARRQVPVVAVVVDTSRSMTAALTERVLAELNEMLRRVGSPVDVIECDDRAAPARRIRRIGSVSLRGGGGTDLRVGILAAADLRPAPCLIIVLTDGMTPWPASAPRGARLVAVVIGSRAPLPSGPGITAVRVAVP
jgi:predicted metal-dependent peptidase